MLPKAKIVNHKILNQQTKEVIVRRSVHFKKNEIIPYLGGANSDEIEKKLAYPLSPNILDAKEEGKAGSPDVILTDEAAQVAMPEQRRYLEKLRQMC